MGDEAVDHLESTEDGGVTWKSLEGPPLGVIATLRFFDAAKGISIISKLNARPEFCSTNDSGRTWTNKDLPIKSYFGQPYFLNPEIGWLIGIALKEGSDGNLGVLKTVDHGASWTWSPLPVFQSASQVEWDWIDQANGWLILLLDDWTVARLLRTRDGGSSWEKQRDESFQGEGKYMPAIRFVTKNVGYAFCDDTQSGRHFLLSTRDGGETWQRSPLKKGVSSCQSVGPELWCTSGMDLLKIRTLD